MPLVSCQTPDYIAGKARKARKAKKEEFFFIRDQCFCLFSHFSLVTLLVLDCLDKREKIFSNLLF